RALERRIMEELGYDVIEVEDGQQAAEYCKTRIPDLILLDWHMPVMNGLDFLKKLRSMQSRNAAKVIFCTTESEVGHIIQAMNSGADEYIMKPFDADIIKGKLQQIGLL